MANSASRILATIFTVAHSSNTPDTDSEFIVRYHCTGPVSGAIDGELVLQTDVTQNETQINTALRTALAAAVDLVVTPAQGYTANDVRGLNL